MKAPQMNIEIERVYAFLKRQRRKEEYVVLVDRIWPRGVSKEALNADEYMPDLGPSHTLRKWFAHQPDRWEVFCERYAEEIFQNPTQAANLKRLKTTSQEKQLTLLYSAKDEKHNQARALKEILFKSKVKS